MTNKELIVLGKDLKMTRIVVLHKHGFSDSEIASIMDISESVVKRLVESLEK